MSTTASLAWRTSGVEKRMSRSGARCRYPSPRDSFAPGRAAGKLTRRRRERCRADAPLTVHSRRAANRRLSTHFKDKPHPTSASHANAASGKLCKAVLRSPPPMPHRSAVDQSTSWRPFPLPRPEVPAKPVMSLTGLDILFRTSKTVTRIRNGRTSRRAGRQQVGDGARVASAR